MAGTQPAMPMPGRGEAPASASLAAGPPLAVLHYDLDARDIAARLARSRAARRRRWQGLVSAGIASILALNVLTGKLPVPDTALTQAAELALILLGPAAFVLWRLHRDHAAQAAAALPAPVPVTLSIHADHAVEDRPDLPRPRTHRARSARGIDLTRRHLILEGDGADLVIPARAFADRASMRLLAEEWSARLR